MILILDMINTVKNNTIRNIDCDNNNSNKNKLINKADVKYKLIDKILRNSKSYNKKK